MVPVVSKGAVVSSAAAVVVLAVVEAVGEVVSVSAEEPVFVFLLHAEKATAEEIAAVKQTNLRITKTLEVLGLFFILSVFIL
jgi:hypothetical protein